MTKRLFPFVGDDDFIIHVVGCGFAVFVILFFFFFFFGGGGEGRWGKRGGVGIT